MTSEHLQYERNFEQNTLVWLDENLNDNEDLRPPPQNRISG